VGNKHLFEGHFYLDYFLPTHDILRLSICRWKTIDNQLL
jgi:hypothetical protein